MDLFNKQQIAVLHGIRRGFVKELLKSIGPTDVIELVLCQDLVQVKMRNFSPF